MATAEQRARAEWYRDAAGERITVSRELYDLDYYLECNYLAGLSVECILRAYRHMIDPEFDARHDIDRLYKLARFAEIVPEQQVEFFGGKLGEVVALWSNEHRFLPENVLRKRWSKRGLYEGIKGDFVKERTRQLIEASAAIVNLGVARWKTLFPN